MRKYMARDLMLLSEDELWAIHHGPIIVVMDDGELVTTGRETIFSAYTWQIHAMYPKTPLCARHHIHGNYISASSHLDLLSHGVWDCFDAYRAQGLDIEVLSKHAYDITNNIYNDFTLRLEEYVTGISALDFVEVFQNPTIANARQRMLETNGYGEHSTDKTNAVIQRSLMRDDELRYNPIAKLARSRLVRAGQIIQCVGARGRPTDIDSHIFSKDVLYGYGTGLTKLEDMMMVSREASLSLYFTKDPMKKSEYFNRNIQLSSATLQNLHHVDCGSRDYLPITINSGKLLQDMLGICYLDAATGTERIITRDSKHLIGTTVGIRSVFTCIHPDRNGVCVRCFGELGLSIPRGTNLGHVCSSETQSKVGQLLLSNKHYVGSASTEKILIGEYERNFIVAGRGNNLYIAPPLHGKSFTIGFTEDQAKNLSDIRTVPCTDVLTPYRLSELTQMQFTVDSGDGPQLHSVRVSSGVRTASLSKEMLRFLKTKDWTIDEAGEYQIDMTGWDATKPFLELPLKQFSTLEYMLQIESFIKGGSTKGRSSIRSYDTASAALMAFHDLVCLKLDVPLSYLQGIILSTMVQSREDRDYRLPLPRALGKPAHYKQLMDFRSMPPLMAHQGQANAIYSPASYLIKVRPPHPLDPLLMG